MAGPVSSDSVPLGGSSLVEMGSELRFQFNESWGAVCFLEGSILSTTQIPSIKRKDFLSGAGIGFRYYTSIGPVRFDVPFPLKQRKNMGNKLIDSAFQIDLSVGQAF
jgi:translocation and assembly module TamA